MGVCQSTFVFTKVIVMKRTLSDVHEQFASFFPDLQLQPWAWYLSKLLGEGHICVPADDESISLSGQPFNSHPTAKYLQTCNRFVSSDLEKARPFILYNDKLYLHRYFRYETQIVDQLKMRIANNARSQQGYRNQLNLLKDLIESLAADTSFDGLTEDEKIDWQLIAIIRTMLSYFSIITGGPGTGKTTTLAKLLRILFTAQPGCRVALAAPTGKASMRMLESLRDRSRNFPQEIVEQIQQLKPFTLHRLLGYKKNSIYFKHNQEQPLPYDWVIVDEASMIDVPMFAKLLMACRPETRILLLGDKDQLASVEAGSLLGDLCISAGKLNRFSSDEINWLNTFILSQERQISENYISTDQVILNGCITELKYSHRFQQQGKIGLLSQSLISGQTDKAMELLNSGAGEISLIDYTDEDSFVSFIKGYTAFMEEPDIATALKNLNLLRVLVTVREGPNGLYTLNRKIEQILYSVCPDLIRPDAGFYINRPVIVTQNNYELGLFNGDVGIVRIDPETNKPRVWFESAESDKPPRPINPAHLSDCETVFAMTIHKSQGSEFEKIMVVLPDQIDNQLLTRELLYTGVTRARNFVVIRGTQECLKAGISRQVERISGIKMRLS